MVLAPAQARKGQSGSLFAQEDMACQVFGIQDFAAGRRSEEVPGRKSAPRVRSALGFAPYCPTLRVIVKGALELVSGTAPLVVALIVTL